MIFVKEYKGKVHNFDKTLNRPINLANLISGIQDERLISELSSYISINELNLWDIGVRATKYLERGTTLIIIGKEDLYVGRILDIIYDEKGEIGNAVGWRLQYKAPWKNVILITGLRRGRVNENQAIIDYIRKIRISPIEKFHMLKDEGEQKLNEMLSQGNILPFEDNTAKTNSIFTAIPHEKVRTSKGLDVKELLKSSESTKIERKTSFYGGGNQYDPVAQEFTVCRTIAAFMNTGGGYLIIGQKDDKTVIGINGDLRKCSPNLSIGEDVYEREINDAIRAYLGLIEPQPEISFYGVEEKKLCLLKIYKSERRVFFTPSSRKPSYNQIFSDYARSYGINKYSPIKEFWVRRGSSKLKIIDPKELDDYIGQHFKK